MLLKVGVAVREDREYFQKHAVFGCVFLKSENPVVEVVSRNTLREVRFDLARQRRHGGVEVALGRRIAPRHRHDREAVARRQLQAPADRSGAAGHRCHCAEGLPQPLLAGVPAQQWRGAHPGRGHGGR